MAQLLNVNLSLDCIFDQAFSFLLSVHVTPPVFNTLALSWPRFSTKMVKGTIHSVASVTGIANVHTADSWLHSTGAHLNVKRKQYPSRQLLCKVFPTGSLTGALFLWCVNTDATLSSFCQILSVLFNPWFKVASQQGHWGHYIWWLVSSFMPFVLWQ